jgi:hypothetical protein
MPHVAQFITILQLLQHIRFLCILPVSNPKGDHKEAQVCCENLTVYWFAMRALSFLPLTSIGYLFIEQEDQKILWLASVLSWSWGSW